jgi:hypothetical protein
MNLNPNSKAPDQNGALYSAFLIFVAARVEQAPASLRAKLAKSPIARRVFLAWQFGVFAAVLPEI